MVIMRSKKLIIITAAVVTLLRNCISERSKLRKGWYERRRGKVAKQVSSYDKNYKKKPKNNLHYNMYNNDTDTTSNNER